MGATRKPGRFYRPQLDILRLVAFLAVFVTHGLDVNQTSGTLSRHPGLARAIAFAHDAGSFGLPLFFFLSAFLITTLLVMEREKTGSVALRSFYVRRMLRIWPLYFVFLGATFVLGYLWLPARFTAGALVAYLALSANWYVCATSILTATIGPLWSISVEEQFYLLWPATVRSLSTRGIRNFCISLACVSLVAIACLAGSGVTVLHIWTNSLAQSLFFSLGGLVALHAGRAEHAPSWWRFLAGAFFCTVCWLVATRYSGFANHNATITPVHALVTYSLCAMGVATLLLGFLHMPRLLIHPALIYLGRISYGLYVFHGLCLLIGRQLVAPHLSHGGEWLLFSLSLTVGLAALSYECLEKPFLKLKTRFEVVHSRPA